MTCLTQQRWTNLWQRLGATNKADSYFDAVIAAYGEPHRFYHNLSHLDDVLSKLDWAKEALEKTGEIANLDTAEKSQLFDTIELALWYHDVIYDPKAKDNETKSRDLFLEHAAHAGIAPEIMRQVAALIDMTAHHATAATLPEKIMADCDLAILGASSQNFQAYDQKIGKEYAFVPADLFAQKRKEVLTHFLNLPRLFKTEAFHNVYDAPARHNLGTALQALSAPVAKTPKIIPNNR